MTLDEYILICSLDKAYKNAKRTGVLNIEDIFMFDLLVTYREFTSDKPSYKTINKFIRDEISKLKYSSQSNGGNLVNIKAKLPGIGESYYTDPDVAEANRPSPPTPVLSNFTVKSSKSTIGGVLYDSYTFRLSDFLANYTDSDDNIFYQLQIELTDLAGGDLSINGITYSESAGDYITMLASDINDIIYFTDTETTNTHNLTVRVVDKDSFNRLTISADATLTVDRSETSTAGNQPATIGDSAIKVANQVTTTLTLAMFTTGLQPPYNDPEGDLIDAIRIDEVSTANTGEFRYNNVPVTVGQIITREDLEAGLFTHVGATSNDIETDAINFSARDEGSGIWVQ